MGDVGQGEVGGGQDLFLRRSMMACIFFMTSSCGMLGLGSASEASTPARAQASYSAGSSGDIRCGGGSKSNCDKSS